MRKMGKANPDTIGQVGQVEYRRRFPSVAGHARKSAAEGKNYRQQTSRDQLTDQSKSWTGRRSREAGVVLD